MTHTGQARHLSVWGAAGLSTRSWGGIAVGAPAAAGWVTKLSVKVKPPQSWSHHWNTDCRDLLISLVWNVHFFCASVSCGQPDVDYNGVVYGNDWWVGSVVRYACRSGFMLVGSPTRSCQPDGRWTPKPICLRECTHMSTPPMLKTHFAFFVPSSLQDCVSRGASKSVKGSWTGPATPLAPTKATWAHPNTAAPG